MMIEILGAGAGGGFPQWNCNCVHCRAVRLGAPGYQPLTQSSLAVSANGSDWLLLNASPDLRQQISRSLQPAAGAPARSSPIKAVALTNADVDHVAGLLTLRERQAFDIYAAPRVLAALAANPLFNILSPDLVARRALVLDQPTRILGLDFEAFAVPGKIALYLEDERAENFGSQLGDTVGFKVSDPTTSRAFFYIPGCARIDAPLAARLKGADLAFFDGTLWSEREMLEQSLMPKTGSRMGHINMSGDDGSLAAFAPLEVKTKVYVHINNSNPALNAAAPERKAIEAAGWRLGEDGMRFTL